MHSIRSCDTGAKLLTKDNARRIVANVGQIMMVKYFDGEKKIIVPPDTPAVRFVPDNLEDLKPGAQIFIVAGLKMPDGTVTAPAINVGRDGVTHPM